MKVEIEVCEADDTERYVWMRTPDYVTDDAMTIGSAYPGKKETDPALAGTKLRALRDARHTLKAALRAVEKEARLEAKRLKKEHARRKAERMKARAKKARR